MKVAFISPYPNPAIDTVVAMCGDRADLKILYVTSCDARHFMSSHNHRNRIEVSSCRFWHLRAGDPHRAWSPTLDFGLRVFKPDLIHCSSEQEGLLSAQIALIRNTFLKPSKLVLYSWQNLLRERSKLVMALCDFTLRHANHITCASSEAADVLMRQNFQGTTDVSPMIGTDMSIFHPIHVDKISRFRTTLGIEAGKLVIGYVGRLAPEKSVNTLLLAVAEVKSPAELIIIGKGECEAALKTLAHDLGISHRCHFLGEVPSRDMPGTMGALDVLVLPSKTMRFWKEQFGRVLTEAMACGIPVIGSSSGAIPEVIGKGGLTFNEEDSTGLANQLDRLAQDHALRTVLGLNGQQRVRENYSLEVLSQKVLATWDSLM